MLATASLLVMPQDQRGQTAFAFDHDQIHRSYLPHMPTNSKVYILDPPYQTNIPAGPWHQDHQQAHNDFVTAFHIPSNHDLKENDLSNSRNLTWWTFTNHQEHYYAAQAILKL